MPEIRKTVEQTVKTTQQKMNSVDLKGMTSKVQQAVNAIKSKFDNSKDLSIKPTIETAVLQKQAVQAQNTIEKLKQQIETAKQQLGNVTPRIDIITTKTTQEHTPDGVSPDDTAIQKVVQSALQANKEYTALVNKESDLVSKIKQLNSQLDTTKKKYSQINNEAKQTNVKQSKTNSIFSQMKGKMGNIGDLVGKIRDGMGNIPNITQKITGNIKQMGKGVRQGLVHVLKYAGALFSLQSIYSMLSNSANSWLSSQNVGAKQLSANIDYMKYAMGSAFAPIVQWVTGLIYNLMKAVQSVVYALFKVNIFAGAGAKQYSSMAKSATKANKQTKEMREALARI